jgi:hypothetical protein
VVAVAEIMAPHVRLEVILVMTLSRFSRNRPSLHATRPSNRQAWLRCGPGEYSGAIIPRCEGLSAMSVAERAPSSRIASSPRIVPGRMWPSVRRTEGSEPVWRGKLQEQKWLSVPASEPSIARKTPLQCVPSRAFGGPQPETCGSIESNI